MFPEVAADHTVSLILVARASARRQIRIAAAGPRWAYALTPSRRMLSASALAIRPADPAATNFATSRMRGESPRSDAYAPASRRAATTSAVVADSERRAAW